jgi:tetratricopeptide (TPR) repeat protein
MAQKTFGIRPRIAMIYALQGRTKDARKIIKQIEEQVIDNAKYSIKLARVYAALGENEKVFDYLEKAFDEHEIDLIALKVDPAWKTIREDDRFKALVKRVGIP